MTAEATTVRTGVTGTLGMLRGELARWMGWRGLFHVLLWNGLVQGFLYLNVATKNQAMGGLGFEVLVNLLVVFPPIAAILLTSAAVCGQYHDGTTAWQLGKPIPRSGHVLATIGGLWAGLTATAIVIPASVAYWWLPRLEPYRFVTPEAPPIGRFAFTIFALSLVLLFFIALTAFLSVAIRRRSVVAVIGAWVLIMLRGAIVYPGWFDFTPARLIRTDLAPGQWSELTEYVHGNAWEAAGAMWGSLGIVAVFGVAAIMVFRRLEL